MAYEWGREPEKNVGDPAEAPRYERPVSKWSVIGLSCLVLLIGCVAAYLFARPARRVERMVEIAEKALNRGDYRESLFQLNAAINLDARDAALYVKRARVHYLLEHDDAAADDCRMATQLNGDLPGRVYRLWSSALLRAGRFRESMRIIDIEYQKAASESQQAMALNTWSYAAALADQDLEKALKRSNESIRLVNQFHVPILAACLDTRAFIYFKLNRYAEGLADIQQAIQGAETRLRAFERNRGNSAYKEQIKRLDRSLAVFLYHRALLYDKLDKPERAEDDRQRVIELGETPNEKLY